MRQLKQLFFRFAFVMYFVIGIPLYVLSWVLYSVLLSIFIILGIPVWILFGEDILDKFTDIIYLPNYREFFGWQKEFLDDYYSMPPMWFQYYKNKMWRIYILEFNK